MGILAWIIFGLIAGAIAQLLMPGEDPGGGGLVGIVITILIGIAGAFLGGFIGVQLGWGTTSSFDVRSLALAVLGAILVLVLVRAFRGGSRSLV
ncbi:MAG: GlsB/YeaQ/YmgE family stress response membrane protein [Tepidiformaceae bacterium]|mgnify:CR=1 FL=1